VATTSQPVTLAAVGGWNQFVSDHEPYIAAVCAALARRDIQVSEMALINAERCREAALTLTPDPSAFDCSLPDQPAVFWDEISGWSLIVHRADIETEYWEGTKVLPDPDAVAAWAVVVLTHPALELARDRVCFRDKDAADPAFGAELARYPASP
jgi:Family of unknown function (DUF6292)